MIITLNSRSTLTLPADLRRTLSLEPGDPMDVVVKDGSLVLTPVAVVPRGLRLTPSGEKKEKEVDAEIAAKKLKRFESAEELLRDLHEDSQV